MATAQIRAEITAQDRASGVLKRFGSNVDKTSMSFTKMAGAVAAGQAAFAALEKVGSTVIDFFKSSIDETTQWAVDMQRLSAATGMNVEQTSGFIAVLGRFGVEGQRAGMMIKAFSKEIKVAATETKKGSSVFDELGIKVKSAGGVLKSTNELLLETADKFAGMKDGAIKTADATALFGRAAVNIIPVLDRGRKGILDLELEAKNLGLVLSTQNAPKVAQFLEAHRKMQDAVKGFKRQIGLGLMPTITALIGKIMDWVKANGGIETIVRTKVMPAINSIIKGIKSAIPVIVSIAKTFLEVFKFVAGAVKAFKVTTLNPLVAMFKWLVKSIKSIVSSVYHFIVDPFVAAFNAVVSVYNATLGHLFGKIGGDSKALAADKAKLAKAAPGVAAPTKHAMGGPVMSGAPYLVGEQGPELFRPTQGGQIIPNNKLSGASTINVSFHGIFTGNELEFRKLAIKVFQAASDVASMQNNDVTAMTTQHWRRA